MTWFQHLDYVIVGSTYKKTYWLIDMDEAWHDITIFGDYMLDWGRWFVDLVDIQQPKN